MHFVSGAHLATVRDYSWFYTQESFVDSGDHYFGCQESYMGNMCVTPCTTLALFIACHWNYNFHKMAYTWLSLRSKLFLLSWITNKLYSCYFINDCYYVRIKLNFVIYKIKSQFGRRDSMVVWGGGAVLALNTVDPVSL